MGRLLCWLGSHTAERSQGVVGYCLRDGCGNLKRVWTGRHIWIRYTEKPEEDARPR
jgi:hypothetical protein